MEKRMPMKKRKARRWPAALACLGLSVLFVLSVGPMGFLRAAAALSTVMAAPAGAFSAAGRILDEQNSETEVDYGSGEWTQLPASSAAASSSQETAPAPAGFGPIIEATYEEGSGERYIQSGAGWVKNVTDLPAAEVSAQMMQALPFTVEVGSSAPQVLIMHTHATETYQTDDAPYYDPAFTCRSTDLDVNMVRVGNEIANRLNAAGIVTLHDDTLHDYPSYTGSYAKSKATVEKYLAQYPSIKVVLDIHRDAIERDDGTRIKPVCTVDGEKTAQIMIICGADNGKMNMPNYLQNLRFASRLQDAVEQAAPGITRPVLFDYRNYNQQLTTGSLLIEIGGHANTLTEAVRAGGYVGDGLVLLFTGKTPA